MSSPSPSPVRRAVAPPHVLPSFHLPRLAAAFVRAWGRRRQRRDLAELDERLLADIGVTPQEARRETARPFWSGHGRQA